MKSKNLNQRIDEVDASIASLRDRLDELQGCTDDAGCLLEVERGQAVVMVTVDGFKFKSERFLELVKWIGDHGGPDWRPEECRIWIAAFEKAIKQLRKSLQ